MQFEPLGLNGVDGRVLHLAPPDRGLARGGRPPSPASTLPGGGLFGAEGPQVGWLVGDSTLALVVASDARAVLGPVAAALRGGAVAAAPPALAQDPAFRAAAARAPGRSGLVYLAVDRLLEAFARLDPAQSAIVGLAAPAGGPSATLAVDWGVDAPRQAFDAAVQLPLARVLALKQVITQLMSAAPGVRSPSAAGARAP
ncbi:MAG: hypothetical protein IPG96_14195 [Proteobacteria bacterium]|nr:hypothetical protein [Pseudomonadota bacterium]